MSGEKGFKKKWQDKGAPRLKEPPEAPRRRGVEGQNATRDKRCPEKGFPRERDVNKERPRECDVKVQNCQEKGMLRGNDVKKRDAKRKGFQEKEMSREEGVKVKRRQERGMGRDRKQCIRKSLPRGRSFKRKRGHQKELPGGRAVKRKKTRQSGHRRCIPKGFQPSYFLETSTARLPRTLLVGMPVLCVCVRVG